jgi:putative SOS response-associated peptidase YedK
VCGRYSLATGDGDRLAERFGTRGWPETTKRYNIAPGDAIAVVAPGGDARAMPWGVGRAINARAETAERRFAGLRRCLVPADGFFEWHGGRPHHLARPDGAPFAMAGLHTGEGVVVVTCPPSPAVAPLHDRMPLILEGLEAEEAWLARAAPCDVAARPFGELVAREVSRAVNDARHDGPDCLGPPAQPALF